jgi:hypothetical protein
MATTKTKKQKNQKTEKPKTGSPSPPKQGVIFPKPSYFQKYSHIFIATAGITLTIGAAIGLLSTYPQVLGTSTSPQVQASTLTPPPPLDDQRTQEIQGQIDHWQQIVESQPTYRDGFVQLAGLYFQLGDHQQVEYCLQQIQTIDPNWEHLDEVTQALQTP